MENLELRLAQIEDWKKRKDDAEYRAKAKAEEEYWKAADTLKIYNKRIENIYTLVDKLNSYGISLGDEVRAYHSPCGLICKTTIENGRLKENYLFAVEVSSSSGFSVDHEIAYYNGEFVRCRTCNSLKIENEKPGTYYLQRIYDEFPKFEKKFYEWFDKKIRE